MAQTQGQIIAQTMETAQVARKNEAWIKFQAETREAHDLWIAGYTGESETREENRARWRIYQGSTGEAWDEYLEAIGAFGNRPS